MYASTVPKVSEYNDVIYINNHDEFSAADTRHLGGYDENRYNQYNTL